MLSFYLTSVSISHTWSFDSSPPTTWILISSHFCCYWFYLNLHTLKMQQFFWKMIFVINIILVIDVIMVTLIIIWYYCYHYHCYYYNYCDNRHCYFDYLYCYCYEFCVYYQHYCYYCHIHWIRKSIDCVILFCQPGLQYVNYYLVLKSTHLLIQILVVNLINIYNWEGCIFNFILVKFKKTLSIIKTLIIIMSLLIIKSLIIRTLFIIKSLFNIKSLFIIELLLIVKSLVIITRSLLIISLSHFLLLRQCFITGTPPL